MRYGLLVLVAAHGLGVHLQDDVGDAGLLGHLGQMLAADAEAHDDEMILEAACLLLFVFRAGGFLCRVLWQRRGSQVDEEGREHHGDDAQGQEGLVADIVEQAGGQTGGGQHEGKFPRPARG